MDLPIKVMPLHTWYDTDVEKVLWNGQDSREIVLKKSNEGSLILAASDVIALAKEFGFVVYRKGANL